MRRLRDATDCWNAGRQRAAKPSSAGPSSRSRTPFTERPPPPRIPRPGRLRDPVLPGGSLPRYPLASFGGFPPEMVFGSKIASFLHGMAMPQGLLLRYGAALAAATGSTLLAF